MYSSNATFGDYNAGFQLGQNTGTVHVHLPQPATQRSSDARLYSWLSSSDHEDQHRSAASDLLERSGEWLRSTSEYRTWLGHQLSAILWLHGNPGAGKTKLVASLINELSATQTTNSTFQLAYFYCKQHTAEPLRSDPDEVLRSLLRQIAFQDAEFKKSVYREYSARVNEKQESNTPPAPLTANEAVDLLSQFQSKNTVIIIIDALDECARDRRKDLLKALAKLTEGDQHNSGQGGTSLTTRQSTRKCRFLIFVSSRDEDNIVLKLQRVPNIYINPSNNKHDIRRFVVKRLDSMIEDGEVLYENAPTAFRREIVRGILAGTEDLFLRAELQLKDLADRSLREMADVREYLRQKILPRSLYQIWDGFYNEIMRDDEPSNSPNNTKPGRVSCIVAKRALYWLMCQQRPISEQAFITAVATGVEDQLEDGLSRERLLVICNKMIKFDQRDYTSARDPISRSGWSSEVQPTIKYKGGTFEFAHLSVREYFEQGRDHVMQSAHQMAAMTCLTTSVSLLQTRKRPYVTDITSGLESSEVIISANHGTPNDSVQPADMQSNEDVPVLPISHLKFEIYALLYWIIHYSAFDKSRIDVDECSILDHQVGDFLISDFACPRCEHEEGSSLSLPFHDFNQVFENWVSLLRDYSNLKDSPIWNKKLTRYLKSTNPALSLVCWLNLPTMGEYLKCFDAFNWNASMYSPFFSHIRNELLPLTKWSFEPCLMVATWLGHLRIVQLMLENGADVNTRDYLGNTVLQEAAIQGHDLSVHCFLKAGSDVNLRSGDYGHALQAAVTFGREKIVKMLLEAGADPSAQKSTVGSRDRGNYDCALMAALVGKFDRIFVMLLNANANPNAQTGTYGTILQAAVELGRLRNVQYLLEKGADPNAVVQIGRYSNALQAAAAKNRSDMVRLLLQFGADVNQYHEDRRYHTALHAAAEAGNTDVVKLLLECTWPSIFGSIYHDALTSASAYGHWTIVKILADRGAYLGTLESHLIEKTRQSASGGVKSAQAVVAILDSGGAVSVEQIRMMQDVFHRSRWSAPLELRHRQ